MRLFFASFLLLVCLGGTKGQNTFNIRERYDFLACVMTGVVPTDSCYYATGIIADTLFPYRAGAIFIKYDLSGNPVNVKSIASTEKTYEQWFNSLIGTEGGNFYNVGYSVDSIYKAFLVKYNAEGDTVFLREYYNPYYPSADYITPLGGAIMLPDKGFAFLNWVATTNQQFGNDTNHYLIRTDSLGNMLWGKVVGSTKWERPMSLRLSPDGKIIGGGIRTNQTTNVQDFVFQCQLFQFDTLGNQEWAWTSPATDGLRDAANDMIVLDDGSIIVASGVGHEQVNSSVNEVYFDRYIFKLNPQHQIEWELTFPDSALTGWSRTTNLVGLSNGSGYILAGMTYNSQPPPKYFTIRGWLAKVSPDGDSIWSRRYAFLTDGENEHEIYDMKETPDGGVIICGKSYDWDDDSTYPQQGWLLKLDGHGCLVPGCHLSDATEEGQAVELGLSIYPNPTSDYLNFYLASPQPLPKDGVLFRIVNGSGQVVWEFSGGGAGTTYVLPVWDWASGTYWLQCSVAGKTITSKQFQIQQ